MLNEKQIADKIFDYFRRSNCRSGQGIMLRGINLKLYPSLNPKEQSIFNSVFIGLQALDLVKVKEDTDFLLLTDTGFDLIYDDELMGHFLTMPWIIPSYPCKDWSAAYNRLWRFIGKTGESPAYITGPKFLELASSVSEKLPPSYGQFYEDRKNKGLSLSRVDFFKDILDSVEDEERYEIYVTIQKYIDNTNIQSSNAVPSTLETDIFETIGSVTEKAQDSQQLSRIVYVSYSWAQCDEMDDICACLENAGIQYKRDKRDCNYRQSIKEFEEEIASGSAIVAILSEKYFTQYNVCMR